MGSSVSCIAHQGPPSIRVVHSDGRTSILDKSVTAGEVTREHPDHSLCDSDSFYIGQKLQALSPKEELKAGHTYFLLPDNKFRSALSLVSLASLVSRRPKGASLLVSQLFEIHKGAPGSGLQIKIRGEFISKLIEDGRFQEKNSFSSSSLCNTPQLQKDYAQLVTSRAQIWRPKLDTIREGHPVPKQSSGRRFKISSGTRSLRRVNRYKSSVLQ